jgi:Glycosyl hydrolases family 18
MPASSKSVAVRANSQPLVAQFFGIFHGISHEGFVNIVNAAPFGVCDLLILGFLHTAQSPVEVIQGRFIARFNNGRDNDFPKGKSPDTDLERVALVVNRARALNPAIKILVSLGYEDGDLAGAVRTPQSFANSVAKLVQEYALDGFDIDYERPTTAEKLIVLVEALKQSLGKVTPKRDMILTITPVADLRLDKSALETFTYVMPQYYGGVPAPGDDWFAKQVGFARIVYGLQCEIPPLTDPLAYAIPARANGAAGIFDWRLDNDDGFVYAVKMRRLMANGTLLLATPDTTAPWQWSPGPDQPLFGVDVSCAGARTGLQTVAVGSDFNLCATTFAGNGNWLPMYQIKQYVSGGPPAFSRVACTSLDGNSLQVIGLGSDGTIYLAFQRGDSTWVSEFFLCPRISDTAAIDVACTATEQGVHVIAINDAKRLWLTTWHSDKQQWDMFELIDWANGPLEFTQVACATTAEGLQVVALGRDPDPKTLDQSVLLWRRVRDTNGNWQPYQKVKDLAPGCPAQVIYATCTSDQDGLHVVVAANDFSLWHSICDANGKWQPFQCVAPGTRPNFISVALGSWTGTDSKKHFQVVGVQAP